MNSTFVKLLSLTILTTGCGAAPNDASDTETGEDLGAIDQSLVGSSRLGAFKDGFWYYDSNNNGVADETPLGPFGSGGDLPLVGYGTQTCGQPGRDMRGVFRPTTGQYFFDDGDHKWDVNRDITSNYADANSKGFVWTHNQPINGVGNCYGTVGYMVQAPVDWRRTVWRIDVNFNRILDFNDPVYNFTIPDSAASGDLWPVPVWNQQAQISVIGVFHRGTGKWYIDKNNNKVFDGCIVDSCQAWGVANDIPFTHSNSKLRGISRFVNGSGGWGWYKSIDGDGNGQWNPPADATYSYLISAYAAFFW
jgi:hypothetical protein